MKPFLHSVLPTSIDGLTKLKNNSILASTKSGVFEVFAPNKFRLIEKPFHGPLKVQGNRLYIQSREKSAVIGLKINLN